MNLKNSVDKNQDKPKIPARYNRAIGRMAISEKLDFMEYCHARAFDCAFNPDAQAKPKKKQLMRHVCRSLTEYEFWMLDPKSCPTPKETQRTARYFMAACLHHLEENGGSVERLFQISAKPRQP